MKLSYKRNEKIYFGAGVIFVENYFNGIRSEPAVILFRGLGKTKLYQDLGGHIDTTELQKNDPLIYTAIRESQEESRNCFKLNPKHMTKQKYIDIPGFRCYFIGISQNLFHSANYRNNKRIIDSLNIDPVWKETDDVQRFYISDLIKCGIKNTYSRLVCKDAGKGKKRFVMSRTVFLLKKAIETELLHEALSNPMTFEQVTNKVGKFKNTISLVSISY